jgi:hypothetical protein
VRTWWPDAGRRARRYGKGGGGMETRSLAEPRAVVVVFLLLVSFLPACRRRKARLRAEGSRRPRRLEGVWPLQAPS